MFVIIRKFNRYDEILVFAMPSLENKTLISSPYAAPDSQIFSSPGSYACFASPSLHPARHLYKHKRSHQTSLAPRQRKTIDSCREVSTSPKKLARTPCRAIRHRLMVHSREAPTWRLTTSCERVFCGQGSWRSRR